MTLDDADAALSNWRERLAAASRNISELSEMPEFSAARATAKGTGRLADEARDLAATMDELWRGVLLIGEALEKAEQARRGGSRLWRGEEAARQALGILNGESITVDLADTPVLHRRLLAGPKDVAVVSPATLLHTMDAAFDRARERLARIMDAGARAAALRDRLAAALVGLPGSAPLAAELAATAKPDPLDRLDALEALAPHIDAECRAAAEAAAALQAARDSMAALDKAAAAAAKKAEAYRAVIIGVLPEWDQAALLALAAWLERIGQTIAQGRASAGMVGLANWRAEHGRVAALVGAVEQVATAALARRDDLLALFGALRARHRTRPRAGLDDLATAARAELERLPCDLDRTARAVNAYQTALARQ
jgi:hypothetical protein